MFLRNSPQKKGCAAKKGFTLLETLVAISIIGIALVAATAALQNSLQTSNFVKDQISAYYLAEDAMEYVVALRDAGAATQGWTSSLLPCITTIDVTAANASLFCATDTFNNTIQNYYDHTKTAISSGVLGVSGTPLSDVFFTPLYSCLDAASGATVFEQPASPIPGNCQVTKFTRKVTITPIQLTSVGTGDANAYSEMIVTVTVSWGSGPQKYVLSEDLYNWQPAS